ncbi:MAG: hypothetical protein HYV96_21120 [Opitutae bacterium]|nr:hypothetical protein [Opitutae bacterium]
MNRYKRSHAASFTTRHSILVLALIVCGHDLVAQTIYVADHNLPPAGTSGVVSVATATGTPSTVTANDYLGSDLFGLAYESSTTLIAVKSGLSNDANLVRIDIATGTQTLLATGGSLGKAIFPAIAPDGTIYVTNDGAGGPGGVTRYTSSGGVISFATGGQAMGIVYDPFNGSVYFTGLTVNAGNPGLARLNLTDGTWTALATAATFIQPFQIAVDINGDLLIADPGTSATGDARIFRYNVATDTVSVLATGNNLRATYVDTSGVIYAGDYGDNSTAGLAHLYTVDRSTGALTSFVVAGQDFANLTAITGVTPIPEPAQVGIGVGIVALAAVVLSRRFSRQS